MLTKYIHVMISTKDMPYYLYISPECFVFLKAIPWGQSNGYYYFFALSPSFSVVESQLCTINTSRSLLVTLLNSPCCLNCTLTSLPILLKLFNFNRVDFRNTNLIDWFWTVFSYLKGPTWPCIGILLDVWEAILDSYVDDINRIYAEVGRGNFSMFNIRYYHKYVVLKVRFKIIKTLIKFIEGELD